MSFLRPVLSSGCPHHIQVIRRTFFGDMFLSKQQKEAKGMILKNLSIIEMLSVFVDPLSKVIDILVNLIP